jgi:leucyl-tRNA synthetase
MLENTGAFAGLTAAEARERVVREAVESGHAAAFPEFSKEVICRCGQQVLIKRIPDQWFIRYSDEALTEESARHAGTMAVTPAEYARDLPATLRWFADRACIRQGAWLGTPFPLDEKWIIEPISDSTLYPAFYIVTPYINAGKISPEHLTEAFFDFVFLGRGAPEAIKGIAQEVVEACRRDFLYWYPLDLNLGGKEHKTVHFPAFVKNHVAIFPEPHWPRGIFVNFWVTQTKGEKLSKSKGGAQPVAQLTSKFGVDALRLYYAHAAAPWLDIEWDPDGVVEYRSRLARIHDTVRHVSAGDLASLGASATLEGSDALDRWLRSSLHRRIEEAHEGWRALDFRQVATPVYFGLLSDLRWYLRRGGRSMEALKEFARPWAALMAPITPHLAEELHRALGAGGFASTTRIPRYDQQARDPVAEEVEAYLASVLDDTQRIRAIAESFATQGRALETVERAAGRKVRGELVGLPEPLELPTRVAKDVSLKGEKVPLLLSGPRGKFAVMVQARRPSTSEDVERALRAASGAPDARAWLLALGGAPQEVRDQARAQGVLLTGPAEFELLAAEAGQKANRPQPTRVVLVTREPWKARVYGEVVEDALKNGKADPGRVLKALSGDAAFKPHMKTAPKVVQEALKDVGSLKGQALRGRAGGERALDEYRVLEGARAFLAQEFGCPVEVLSADNPSARDERLRGKADAAAPFRPAIAIEY